MQSSGAQVLMRDEKADYNTLFTKEKVHVREKVALLIEDKKFDIVEKLLPLRGQKSLDFIIYYPEISPPRLGYNYLFEAILAFLEKPAEEQRLLYEFINAILQYDPAQCQFIASREPDKGRTVLHVALIHMTHCSDLTVSMIQSLINTAPNLANIPTTTKKALPIELALLRLLPNLFELILLKTTDLNYKNGAHKTILTLISEVKERIKRNGSPSDEVEDITKISTLFNREFTRRKAAVEVEPFSLDMNDPYQRSVAIVLARVQAEHKQKQLLEDAQRRFSLLSLSERHADEAVGKKKQLPTLARLTVDAADAVEQKLAYINSTAIVEQKLTYIHSTAIDAKSLPTSHAAPVAGATEKKQYPICAERMDKKKRLPAIARFTVLAANVTEEQGRESITYDYSPLRKT